MTRGLHVMAVADLAGERARAALRRAGWTAQACAAAGPEAARASGGTWVTEDADALTAAAGLDVVIEATGVPGAGIRHALGAIGAGRHIVMVNVEADVLAGPLLAARARAAGVIYSLAYGDQPALICEQVDWARASGFAVVCAGKGTKYRPEYHASTPDTVWSHYGLSAERAAAAGMNPRMFNSFLDGTKSAIEMASVANATGLTPAAGGLTFPPCGRGELAARLRPRAAGGVLSHMGTVEVISSEHRDGTPVEDDLRWGTYVVFEAPSEYVARCFTEYGIAPEGDDRYAALYRPVHLIGLELGISVAAVALRGEATGVPDGFRADVVAVAKRDLAAGRSSTARAATRCGAGSRGPPIRWPRAPCRSGSPAAAGCGGRCRRGRCSDGRTWRSMRPIRRCGARGDGGDLRRRQAQRRLSERRGGGANERHLGRHGGEPRHRGRDRAPWRPGRL